MTTDTRQHGELWQDYQRLDKIQPDPQNPKDHALAVIGRSIDEFGFMEVLRVDERTGLLSSGHGRFEQLTAMRATGDEPPAGILLDEDGAWLVPVTRGWASRDDDHAYAALIASNRITELGGWADPDLLAGLERLQNNEALLAATGFRPDDVDDILARLQEIAFTPGGGGDEGARTDKSYGQFAENYRNRQVRSFIFDFPLDDYAFLAEAMKRMRLARGVESNAELILAIAREWDAANPVAAAS